MHVQSFGCMQQLPVVPTGLISAWRSHLYNAIVPSCSCWNQLHEGWLGTYHSSPAGWPENLGSVSFHYPSAGKCKQWCSPIPLVLRVLWASGELSPFLNFLCVVFLSCLLYISCSIGPQLSLRRNHSSYRCWERTSKGITLHIWCVVGRGQAKCPLMQPSWTHLFQLISNEQLMILNKECISVHFIILLIFLLVWNFKLKSWWKLIGLTDRLDTGSRKYEKMLRVTPKQLDL